MAKRKPVTRRVLHTLDYWVLTAMLATATDKQRAAIQAEMERREEINRLIRRKGASNG